MPKNKKNNGSKNVNTSNNGAKPATTETPKVPQVIQPDAGKEVATEKAPEVVAVPADPPKAAVVVDLTATWVVDLKASDLLPSDLVPGNEYVIVKCVHLSPPGHFPDVDRELYTDAPILAKFLRWEELYMAGTIGMTLDGATEEQVKTIEAAYSKSQVAVFNDGRAGYAIPAYATVPECDVKLLVYPNNEEGHKAAFEAATFFSARSFSLGWTEEIISLLREMLLSSANVPEMTEWLAKQPISVLRKACSVWGGKVKEVFKEGVTKEAALPVVLALRGEITKDPKKVEALAKRYTETRAAWEASRKGFEAHQVVEIWRSKAKAAGRNLNLAKMAEEVRIDEAKAASVRAAKAAAKTPKETAVKTNGLNITNLPSGEVAVSVKGGKLTIDQMKAMIAAADAKVSADEAKKAEAERVAKAEAAADAVKKAEIEAAKNPAVPPVLVTDNSPKDGSTTRAKPKVKSKDKTAAKLARVRGGEGRIRHLTFASPTLAGSNDVTEIEAWKT